MAIPNRTLKFIPLLQYYPPNLYIIYISLVLDFVSYSKFTYKPYNSRILCKMVIDCYNHWQRNSLISMTFYTSNVPTTIKILHRLK